MSVIEGNFKQKKTPRSVLTPKTRLDIDESSTLEYNHWIKILRDYNIGISSRLYLLLPIETTNLKGKHMEEVIDLIENKGVALYDIPETTPTDYSAPIHAIYGYLERGLTPVLYPIMPNSMVSEVAGVKMPLPFINDVIKGPSIVHALNEKIIAVEVLFNTVDETEVTG